MFVRGGGGLFFLSLSNCAWQHNITPLEKSCKGPHFHVVPGFKLEQQQFSCKQILFMGAGGKSNYALLFLTPLEIGVFFLHIQKRNSIPSDVSLLLWKTLDGRSFSSLGGSVGLGQPFLILHIASYFEFVGLVVKTQLFTSEMFLFFKPWQRYLWSISKSQTGFLC